MLRFWSLGRLDLRAEDGRPVREALSQPKRAALLAYLAIASPQGRRRRDVVASVFWPESDSRHAHAALRKSLHFLRSVLGPGVITGRRSPVLGVSRERLWTDVGTFRDACREQREEVALDLYRGALLDGFFLDDTRAFEEWLHGEREALRRQAARAASSLSERSEEPGDAIRWARRALDLAPYNEQKLRRLIRLLDASGRRAEAVRLYREFERRVERELRVSPAPETRDLLETVRTRQ